MNSTIINSTEWNNPFFYFFFYYATSDSKPICKSFFTNYLSKSIALILLFVFSPLLILISLIIKISMKGDVLFKQTRVGKNDKYFDILKFRTMIPNAEELTGHVLSWDGDSRITTFGKFLRKSHLDELPQLINIIMGEMSFIGPRPERPEFTKVYDQEIINYSKSHEVLPGVTGLSQILCEYNVNAEQKTKYDLLYISYSNNFIINTLILIYTIKKIMFLSPTANIIKIVKETN